MNTSQNKLIEKELVKARKSIEKYCFSECKAYCCRNGYLLLNKTEVDLITNNNSQKLIDGKLITETDNNQFVLEFKASDDGCPSLKEHKCTIHTNKNRPLTCKQYPLFLWGEKTIKASQRCPAVESGLLYASFAKFKQMGLKLVF